ncbi:lipocalin-like domain-containing protein [Chitinophaga rhizophila]|uniref:Lipocalin family protein n=1 Tax=Chitinophaga rhizophila TaxID=2866212 RepID=A0ABS7G771_9BACT|nr:lipocalin family protein [Chitinophaga rhizophila]MBW8682985.1 lipocalin family protein [Chitinophaga rhizophila]
MKTTTLKWTLLTAVTASMFFSCKKEDNKPTGCPINTTNIAGTYRMTGIQYTPGPNETPIDFMKFMDECEKDDMMTFASDGKYTYDDAGTVCETEGSDEGVWKLENNRITIDGEVKGNIASFDCKSLVLYVDGALEAGDRMTITYVKKN